MIHAPTYLSRRRFLTQAAHGAGLVMACAIHPCAALGTDAAVAPGQAETTVPITDAHIQAGLSPYNWICTKDFISSSVCGASLSVGFKGTKQVAILVDSAMAARKDPLRIPVIAWSVNGGALQTYQFGLEEKSFVLASGVQDPVIDLYIKGMSPSERRWDTDLPVNSLKILGFKVDDGAVTVPTPPPEKIWLNIGDSIMSGDGALQEEKSGRPKVWATTGDARPATATSWRGTMAIGKRGWPLAATTGRAAWPECPP